MTKQDVNAIDIQLAKSVQSNAKEAAEQLRKLWYVSLVTRQKIETAIAAGRALKSQSARKLTTK